MSKDLNCSYFINNRCRSCSLLSLAKAERRQVKRNTFLSALSEVLDKRTQILDILEPNPIFPSRAKAKLSVSGTNAEPVIGLLDSSFNGIELINCPLHFSAINSLLETLVGIVTKYKLTPYDVYTRKGELKGVIINSNSDSSELMLRFVIRSTESIPRIKKAALELQGEFPALKVISVNIQAIPHQIVEGEEELILSEHSVIWEKYGDLKFALSPQCFSQVTPEIATRLYSYVQELVKTSKPDELLDLFCGIGGFSLFAAKYAGKVRGVEYSSAAIECAKLSSKTNKVMNAEFDSSDTLEFLNKQTDLKPDSVILNPPRRGLSNEINQRLIDMAPKELIYSSCSPKTLVRDLKQLRTDYRLLSLAPFEMFPLTEHLEVVAHLERK
jgi:23S rRNA (uracil747-C5)-methyltransferase